MNTCTFFDAGIEGRSVEARRYNSISDIPLNQNIVDSFGDIFAAAGLDFGSAQELRCSSVAHENCYAIDFNSAGQIW